MRNLKVYESYYDPKGEHTNFPSEWSEYVTVNGPFKSQDDEHEQALEIAMKFYKDPDDAEKATVRLLDEVSQFNKVSENTDSIKNGDL